MSKPTPLCCGSPCRTPFCPTCGKRTERADVYALLEHLQMRAATERTRATELKSRDEAGEERLHPFTLRRAAVADKWERWRDIVSAWIKRDEKTLPETKQIEADNEE